MPEELQDQGVSRAPLPPRGWRDVVHDLLRPSRSQLVVALVLLFSGLAVTMQLLNGPDQRYSTLRRDELVAMLDDVTAESRRLEDEVRQLEQTRDRLQSGVDADRVARDEARKRLDTVELLGGSVRAHGAGVRIEITDTAGKLTPEIMLNTIEELRDAGAEVIEVDDHIRLVAGSWVGSQDGHLVIDGQPLGRTIALDVIGDPATLEEATRFRGGLVATVEGDRVGGRATVVRVPNVRIDATVAPEPMRWGRRG